MTRKTLDYIAALPKRVPTVDSRRRIAGMGAAIMVADWHVKGCDKTWVLTQLSVLATRQRQIEDKIRDAVYRQRFSHDKDEIDRARKEEQHHLKALDSLMTAMRAIEGKLMLMPLDS